MDPIGLGLENFDGMGRWRDTEGGSIIDPSGELDGVAFSDAWELGERISTHPDFGACFSKHLYEYTTGHVRTDEVMEYHDWLTDSFAAHDWSFLQLLRNHVHSAAFRQVGQRE